METLAGWIGSLECEVLLLLGNFFKESLIIKGLTFSKVLRLVEGLPPEAVEAVLM